MHDSINKAAKETGFELIAMSETLSNEMQIWADVLAHNPDSDTAKLGAGFITKFTIDSEFELVIDVQTPPDEKPILRTWAIQTTSRENQQDFFYSIQLTFSVASQLAQNLVAKSVDITREDIRKALQTKTSQLTAIAISDGTSGDGTKQTHGKRYDYTTSELSKQTENTVDEVQQAMQKVLSTLKLSMEKNNSRD